MTHLIIRFLIVTGMIPVFAATSHAMDLNPDRIGWSALQFKASKFLMTIHASVGITTPDPAAAVAQLITAGEGKAVQPHISQKILSLRTEAFGRLSQIDLILNAENGAALQRTSHDSGSRYRHRIYRFTDRGAYQKTRWPIGKAEEKLPADQWPQWSEAKEDLRPYPSSVFGAVITDPSGLLYIVGAAPLDEPGDTFEILTYARKHVHRVQIEVTGMDSIKLNYQFESGAIREKREGKQQAIRLLIRGEGIDDGDSDDEFELLGLRGDIVLHMDPTTRAPLQLEGRVKIAGHVTMRLVNLTIVSPDHKD